MKDTDLIKRVDHLLLMSKTALDRKIPADSFSSARVFPQDYAGFKAASLSFIGSIYGIHHSYYTSFDKSVWNANTDRIQSGVSILMAIRHEIEHGWLTKLRTLISAEIFSDFLDMSEHLLETGYKDAAAVMIGSTLEEHLRQLCDTYKVDKTTLKGNDAVIKKSEVLNVDLKKADVYSAIDQKQVTAWLGLRNSAAHGKYDDYTKEQVKGMYDGVLNFISRVH